MSNISLLLSGGIHDSYCIELVSYLSKKKKIEIKSKTGQVLWKLYGAYFDKPELVLPDQAQLYDILAAAMQTNNLVGCFQFEVTAHSANIRICDMVYNHFNRNLWPKSLEFTTNISI